MEIVFVAAKLFFSYSHCDEEYRDRLEVHLSSLKRDGLIDSWHDRKIEAGSNLEGSISDALGDADIVLLLVSADFIASDYCFETEFQTAMRRHANNECIVVPIILRPCDWHSQFGEIMSLPKDGLPISLWSNEDSAYLDATKSIRSLLLRVQSSQIENSADISAGLSAADINVVRIARASQKLESFLKEHFLASGHGLGQLRNSVRNDLSNDHPRLLILLDEFVPVRNAVVHQESQDVDQGHIEALLDGIEKVLEQHSPKNRSARSIVKSRARHIMVDGGGLGDYETISAALAIAQDGDTLFVMPGVYNEALYIDKEVTIKGQKMDAEEVIIDSEVDALEIATSNVNLSNLRVRTSGPKQISIVIYPSQKSISVADCQIRSESGIGMITMPLSGVSISDTEFSDCELGLRVEGAIEITNSKFEKCKNSVHLRSRSTSEIKHSVFDGADVGIVAEGSAQSMVISNDFIDVRFGVTVEGHASLSLSNNNFRDLDRDHQIVKLDETSEVKGP